MTDAGAITLAVWCWWRRHRRRLPGGQARRELEAALFGRLPGGRPTEDEAVTAMTGLVEVIRAAGHEPVAVFNAAAERAASPGVGR